MGEAKIVARLNEIGMSGDEATRVTVGRLDVKPNSTSSIPGEVYFHIDFRHPDQVVLDRLETQFREEVKKIATDLNLEYEFE